MLGALREFIDFYVLNNDNSGWWAGFAPECARTNNGLESHNRQLKERDFLRRRVSIREFLKIAPSNMKVASLSPEHQVYPLV